MPLFGFGRKKSAEPPPATRSPYLDLRSMILSADASAMERKRAGDHVLGVVIDWSVGGNFATFVAMADGTSSMYLSSGGGTIGAGGRPGIDAAAERLLGLADAHVEEFQPASVTDPAEGRVAYWVLTRSGLRKLEHDAGGPPPRPSFLAELADAFQEYVTQFRLLDEARPEA